MYTDSDNRAQPFYVVPLEPTNLAKGLVVYEENDGRPSTADIIAQQSQDYVDEKLAEYQATISLLQGKEFPFNPIRKLKRTPDISETREFSKPSEEIPH